MFKEYNCRTFPTLADVKVTGFQFLLAGAFISKKSVAGKIEYLNNNKENVKEVV